MDWSKQKIIVTGGGGFLGQQVVGQLSQRGCKKICVPRSKDFDLRQTKDIQRLFKIEKPDLVIHLAAVVGGIGANQKHPGKYFYDNAMMGLELIEQSRQFEIKKFVAVGTICSYPKFAPLPFKECDLWSGYPEETNAPYGLAKKMMLVQAQAYRSEYGFNAIYLMPVNLFGPADNFDPDSSHVIPAIIKKCIEARKQGITEIVLWGDGTPTREFLYVEDAAEGICLATENYNGPEPINLGSGQEISIRELSQIIAEEVGFTGKIIWDASKPNGQPRRQLDVSKARELFGFQARTEFRPAVAKTIRWYLNQLRDSEAFARAA